MTRQESFKKRVRARMLKTGERYAAARRVLLAQAEGRSRTWVSEPEVGEESLRKATGRGWEEWCDVIDAWPEHGAGHTAIARYLVAEHGVSSWWAQTVTGGYERITGLRLPYQQPDGTFTANKSKTVRVAADQLSAALRDSEAHQDLFPGLETQIRSRAHSKTVRVAMPDGVALFSVAPKEADRCKVTIQHAGLADPEAVERWKFTWEEWLAALG